MLSALELEQGVGVATALDVAQQATTAAPLRASIPPLVQQLQQNIDALLRDAASDQQNGSSMLSLTIDGTKPFRQACLLRFRPFVMTTTAALLGALPLMVEHSHRFRVAPAAGIHHGW